ncbi:cytidylate kinase family protein [Clostridium boliviensis]|uniref:Cytidylate kinase family protein n=1 Tax=Clostridium boliviensis TaxID=318465 RepID=A0ABU4GFJ6_9CLOT|nr:cytidylate kinase family protein [Clostridium boliviensis]MDW2796398.1 cytidylate kinase family protein [Clostridium boliviensis]
MKIINISREFGSGGRELAKRLADTMNFDYYDSEIIAAVAKKSGLDQNYVEDKRDAYHLTINTSDWNIKDLASSVAAFASSWFGRDS